MAFKFAAFAVILVAISFESAQSYPNNATLGTDYYYYKNWCGGSLQYLDDKFCTKAFPSNFNREWSCPVAVETEIPTGFHADGLIQDVDTTSLSKFVTSEANLCLIVSKRVSVDAGIRMYNKYFCVGDYSATEVWETWSSSKIFAMANAGRHLRKSESSCAEDLTGLDASTEGTHGTTPLGDLATIVCSYDHTAGYSSNSLSSFFHDMVS